MLKFIYLLKQHILALIYLLKQHNIFILCVNSVESLPEELKESFEMLTVFDYDFPVSLKALCTIWNVEELDAEEYMNGLCSHTHS